MTAIIGHGVRLRSYADRQLPDRYVAHVEYERRPGQRRNRTEKAFPTERAALAWIRGKLGETRAEQRRARVERHLTVGEVLDRWVQHGSLTRDWAPNTARRARQHADRDLLPLREITADDLTPSDVERFMGRKLRDGLAPASVRRMRAALSGALQLACKDGHLDRNVARLAEPPPAVTHEPRYLDQDQARRFLAALDGERQGAFYRVCLALALRPSEAIGLRWSDIDWKARTVTIERAALREGKVVHLRPTKTRQTRTIAVPAPLLETLRAHRSALADRGKRAAEWARPDLVFANRAGDYLDQHSVLKQLRVILARIDAERADQLGRPLRPEERMPRISAYQLRHTGATLLLAMGVPPHEIQAVLGHASLTTTMRYARLTQEARRNPADRMGEFLTGSSTKHGRDYGRDKKPNLAGRARTKASADSGI